MSALGIWGTLLHVGAEPLATRFGDFRLHRFRNVGSGRLALAAVRGDIGEGDPLLARVHSSCVTSETYAGCDCDCAEQLSIALAEIAAAGRGIVFYLMQEGRGAGFAAKARDRMLVQASNHRLTTFEAYAQMGLGRDLRRYDEVAAICALLGVTAPLCLLTNNPDKIAAVAAEGLVIDSIRSLENAPSPFNVHYVSSKQRSGHHLSRGGGLDRAADLPEPVDAFTPYALEERPSVVHAASYLLPVRFADEEPCWFRVHAYVDTDTGDTRAVLTHRGRSGALPLASLQRDSVIDRLPRHPESATRRRWRTTAAAIAERGAGAVLFESERAAPDAVGVALLARHAAPA